MREFITALCRGTMILVIISKALSRGKEPIVARWPNACSQLVHKDEIAGDAQRKSCRDEPPPKPPPCRKRAAVGPAHDPHIHRQCNSLNQRKPSTEIPRLVSRLLLRQGERLRCDDDDRKCDRRAEVHAHLE